MAQLRGKIISRNYYLYYILLPLDSVGEWLIQMQTIVFIFPADVNAIVSKDLDPSSTKVVPNLNSNVLVL